jgi:acyl-CoA reductase-like NAD-dependent aldehyde dehydrogenase
MMTAASKTLTCISPVDGSIFAERQIMSEVQVNELVTNAKQAQKEWSQRPIDQRIALVLKGVQRLGEMNEQIVPALAHMMGRPVRYGGEFGGVNERAEYMAKIAEEALQPLVIEESDDYERRIMREPHGLVFVIAPWNYPYLTAINTIVPALIAGNAVFIKHATQTLLVGETLVSAFVKAGLPEYLFQNLFLDHATTDGLLQQRCFDFINFTGSVGGGQAVERSAAGTFASLGLELGGKDPAYVMNDANLDAAVEALVDGAMFNSGQCCCGIERIYVDENLYDAFVHKFVSLVSTYALGSPLDEASTLGPMANKRFADEVRAQITEAIDAGAEALIDASLFPRDDGTDAYLAPQVLVNVNHEMRIMRDETFGPVVGIMKVADDLEAVALMNDCQFGLTASLWTSDAERAAEIAARLETGTVFMNRADYLDPALCWTGCKDTGRGGALSHIGYQNLTRVKSYHFKKVR